MANKNPWWRKYSLITKRHMVKRDEIVFDPIDQLEHADICKKRGYIKHVFVLPRYEDDGGEYFGSIKVRSNRGKTVFETVHMVHEHGVGPNELIVPTKDKKKATDDYIEHVIQFLTGEWDYYLSGVMHYQEWIKIDQKEKEIKNNFDASFDGWVDHGYSDIIRKSDGKVVCELHTDWNGYDAEIRENYKVIKKIHAPVDTQMFILDRYGKQGEEK